MKFIAFFAFVAIASVSAITTIYPSTSPKCRPLNVPPISKCGDTNLFDQNIAGVQIVYEGQAIVWFEQLDCNGAHFAGDDSESAFALNYPLRRSV